MIMCADFIFKSTQNILTIFINALPARVFSATYFVNNLSQQNIRLDL